MLASNKFVIVFLKILVFNILIVNGGFQRNKQYFTTKSTTTLSPTTTQKANETFHVPNPVNSTYARLFQRFISSKSEHLSSMTKRFTSHTLLDNAYNSKLRGEVNINYMNLTEMVIEISMKLSRILYETSQVVKNLSEYVENSYVDYKLNIEKVNESISHVYYDSKSPKTFCDVSDFYENKKTREPRSVLVADSFKKDSNYYSNNFHYSINKNWKRSVEDFDDMITNYYPNKENQTLAVNDIFNDEIVFGIDEPSAAIIISSGSGGGNLKELFWDVNCINRTSNQNFESAVKKVNLDESTIHVPTNIFKQNMAINMTAYWTESLNKQFKINNENNKQLDWQYFCSSLGLYRQYPGAFWTIPPREDFFDCRLQSWYVTAATSAKDVLILLDTSGSMTGIRLEIAKKLIEFLFDTFTDNDFFNIITYSNVANFLMPEFSNMFIQADKHNKQSFIDSLRSFKNTSHQGNLKSSLIKAFRLFNDTSLTRSGCNKILMILTDGQEKDEMENVFMEYNRDKMTRVFAFKIGRDMKNLDEVKRLACENNGEFFHVMSTDINEHVSKYISVLSRPMAMLNIHETKWSSVFVGYLDKELKIAAARPTFIQFDHLNDYDEDNNKSQMNNDYDDLITQNDQLQKATGIILNQKVLLGVVGVDVALLKLITRVSPKFRMGTGIYLIILDNNGYIVYHPSIRGEIGGESSLDFKSRSHSVDLDKFEIPIGDYHAFESLEHEMIDRKTSSKAFYNMKRDGIKLVQRHTNYVYTPIFNTPFSLALASPTSYAPYNIFIEPRKSLIYDRKLKEILSTDLNLNSVIQFYNCTYSYTQLIDLVLNEQKSILDSCIKDLRSVNNSNQLIAFKFDLLLHNFIAESRDYSVLLEYQDAARSVFYSTYSGLTFHQSVNLINQPEIDENNSEGNSGKISYGFEKKYYTESIEFSDYIKSIGLTDTYIHYTSNGRKMEASKETRSIHGAIPIWLEQVPIGVGSVMYDENFFNNYIFKEDLKIDLNEYENVCNNELKYNVTCYVLDEHASIVSVNEKERANMIGKAFYKDNPWLMLELEAAGFYELILPGLKLEGCKVLQEYSYSSSSVRLFSSMHFLFKTTVLFIQQIFAILINSFIHKMEAYSRDKWQLIKNIESSFENDVKYRNSHCSYFGIYSFNMSKWLQSDTSLIRMWCNNLVNANQKRNFLVGHIEKSNLLMVIAENEPKISECKGIPLLIKSKRYNQKKNYRNEQVLKEEYDKKKKIRKNEHSANRYRSNSGFCYDFYPNESSIFRCNNADSGMAFSVLSNHLILTLFYFFFYFEMLLLSFFK